jgi:RNA-binding protein
MTSPASKSPVQSLTGKQTSYLRSLAHALKPVVQIGKNGWSEGVRAEIDGALLAHELIKVSLGRETPIDAAEAAELIAKENKALVVQVIGKIVVVYRRHPQKPKIELPKKRRGAAAAAAVPAKKKGAYVPPELEEGEDDDGVDEDDDDGDGDDEDFDDEDDLDDDEE